MGRDRHPHATGAGPGVITDDGCPVDLWTRLPAGDAPAIIHACIAPQASVLDLGAGTGRLAHPLAAMGHPVVAVDESPAMLSHVHGARRVCSTIEDLALGTTFDAVLLAANLVNTPDPRMRHALLTACRRHVDVDGLVLLQRYPHGWADAFDGTTTKITADIVRRIRVVARHGDHHYTIEATTTLDERAWTQRYAMQELDDEALDQDLRAADLRLERWISDDGSWVSAATAPAAARPAH